MTYIGPYPKNHTSILNLLDAHLLSLDQQLGQKPNITKLDDKEELLRRGGRGMGVKIVGPKGLGFRV